MSQSLFLPFMRYYSIGYLSLSPVLGSNNYHVLKESEDIKQASSTPTQPSILHTLILWRQYSPYLIDEKTKIQRYSVGLKGQLIGRVLVQYAGGSLFNPQYQNNTKSKEISSVFRLCIKTVLFSPIQQSICLIQSDYSFLLHYFSCDRVRTFQERKGNLKFSNFSVSQEVVLEKRCFKPIFTFTNEPGYSIFST